MSEDIHVVGIQNVEIYENSVFLIGLLRVCFDVIRAIGLYGRYSEDYVNVYEDV